MRGGECCFEEIFEDFDSLSFDFFFFERLGLIFDKVPLWKVKK